MFVSNSEKNITFIVDFFGDSKIKLKRTKLIKTLKTCQQRSRSVPEQVTHRLVVYVTGIATSTRAGVVEKLPRTRLTGTSGCRDCLA